MHEEFLSRTSLLLGAAAMATLQQSRVAVFGLGGVGSFAAESLARCGIGSFLFVDHDVVGGSNLNRQLTALHSTLGRPKVEVMRARVLDINPSAEVEALQMFYRPEDADNIDFGSFTCVADAIDTVRAKMDLIARTQKLGIPIVSCMGAGNRTDPTQIFAGDLSETDVCPLCRAVRKKLRRRGIEHVPVVYSREIPVDVPKIKAADEHSCSKRPTSGTIAFVPAVAGMVLASEVVRQLLGSHPPLPRVGDYAAPVHPSQSQ
jgi:tRNA A37 threonylcarbamoyladenosine dehydratase